MIACIFCERMSSKVVNARLDENGWYYRRRECKYCLERFSTYEIRSVDLDLTEFPEKRKVDYDATLQPISDL